MSTETTGHLNGATPSDPAELRAEISRTRLDLSETAAELVTRADVRTRIRARATQLVRRPVPVAIIAAVVSAATVAAVLIRRSRH